ncbi:hypothetical protein Cgig2_018228 [Carnegiea gigantea]|uniref:Uncharacterized protein n=1 Tax=Carnegiea gigantea TaxID=171969 RepID=A0A9Q1KXN8_9CARY|nr:hypothetical protein Cgig2_018228 [Carnegiea gigantea]
MNEPIGIPACFSSGEKLDHPTPVPLTRSSSGTGSPQSLIMSIYRTKIASQSRLVTITWCKNLLLHGLSVSVSGPQGHDHHHCKVELKPWYFWRKYGSKQFVVDGKVIGVVWDLKAAKFNGEVEPQSDYYVAIVSENEVVLVVGDMKKEAFRRTGCRPALVDPVLVSRKEHVFGKKRFSTKVKFHERGKCHEISVECNNNVSNHHVPEGSSPEMDIKIDGELATQVKHLQWKFRGNESIDLDMSFIIFFAQEMKMLKDKGKVMKLKLYITLEKNCKIEVTRFKFYCCLIVYSKIFESLSYTKKNGGSNTIHKSSGQFKMPAFPRKDVGVKITSLISV